VRRDNVVACSSVEVTMGRRHLHVVGSIAVGMIVLAGCSSATPAAKPSVVHTTTTLANPVRVPSASPYLRTVAFVNPGHGYGMWVRQGSVRCRGLVGSTHDGGATFGPLVEVTSWPCAENPPAQALAFDDRGDGFLYGPDLFVTHDGGATWARSRQPGAILSVVALGRSVWSVWSECPASSTEQICPLALRESADGGRTWSSSMAPADALTSVGVEGESGQTSLVRLSPSSAYLLGGNSGLGNGNVLTQPMWFTSDGGASWSTRSTTCATPGFVAMAAAPDGSLVTVCAGTSGAGSQEKSAQRSTDGGVTWAVESNCPFGAPTSPCESAPLNFGYLGGIVAPAPDTVFLYGDRAALLVSHDEGTRWQEVRPQIGGTSWGTSRVTFFNESDGVVLGDNERQASAPLLLWHTSDGGRRWRSVAPRVS
jgi:photosystem II stability/assembly factor-like uncharacterized protein